MAALFLVLALLFFLLYLREHIRNHHLHQEITYIKNRISNDFYMRENGYILVPSENPEVKELSAQMNRLLESFYLQRADYKRSKQAMVQVLTNISHDLRTPLTVLKGYSELLVREAGKGDVSSELSDLRDMIAKVDSKAGELVRMINDFFTMARIESGDMAVDLQRTNITAVCHEVILDYYDLLEKEQFEVDIQIDPVPVFAYADSDALKRILKNLIDNVIRHGGSGKYLGIRLKQDAGRILIEIEDHGEGIAARNQEQIFFRTYTTANRSSGSGLGLAIAKNLALQMEADLLVASEPNQKTVFTLIVCTAMDSRFGS